MITVEKIKIFDNYDGDIDGFSRVGRDYEKELIDDDDWSVIDKFLHNVGMINKGLSSQTFTNQTLTEIKQECDIDGFKYFTSQIDFYSDFQNVVTNKKRHPA
jgi:hypothetical protein